MQSETALSPEAPGISKSLQTSQSTCFGHRGENPPLPSARPVSFAAPGHSFPPREIPGPKGVVQTPGSRRDNQNDSRFSVSSCLVREVQRQLKPSSTNSHPYPTPICGQEGMRLPHPSWPDSWLQISREKM